MSAIVILRDSDSYPRAYPKAFADFDDANEFIDKMVCCLYTKIKTKASEMCDSDICYYSRRLQEWKNAGVVFTYSNQKPKDTDREAEEEMENIARWEFS